MICLVTQLERGKTEIRSFSPYPGPPLFFSILGLIWGFQTWQEALPLLSLPSEAPTFHGRSFSSFEGGCSPQLVLRRQGWLPVPLLYSNLSVERVLDRYGMNTMLSDFKGPVLLPWLPTGQLYRCRKCPAWEESLPGKLF